MSYNQGYGAPYGQGYGQNGGGGYASPQNYQQPQGQGGGGQRRPPNEGFGSLFQNSYKTNENHPDFRGDCTFRGQHIEIAAWWRQARNGSNYLSLRVQPYGAGRNQNQNPQQSFPQGPAPQHGYGYPQAGQPPAPQPNYSPPPTNYTPQGYPQGDVTPDYHAGPPEGHPANMGPPVNSAPADLLDDEIPF